MARIKYLQTFYNDLDEALNYISTVLLNPSAAVSLLNDVEQAILKRSENPEAFEKFNSIKERIYSYYRIYVNNFVIYYVVIPGDPPIMEVRRFLYNRRNKNRIV